MSQKWREKFARIHRAIYFSEPRENTYISEIEK